MEESTLIYTHTSRSRGCAAALVACVGLDPRRRSMPWCQCGDEELPDPVVLGDGRTAPSSSRTSSSNPSLAIAAPSAAGRAVVPSHSALGVPGHGVGTSPPASGSTGSTAAWPASGSAASQSLDCGRRQSRTRYILNSSQVCITRPICDLICISLRISLSRIAPRRRNITHNLMSSGGEGRESDYGFVGSATHFYLPKG
jgi:hypothetical protein